VFTKNYKEKYRREKWNLILQAISNDNSLLLIFCNAAYITKDYLRCELHKNADYKVYMYIITLKHGYLYTSHLILFLIV
jgi:hypothetical protein